MKYLRSFENQANYDAAKRIGDFYTPCVSLIEDTMSVAYDPSAPVPPTPDVPYDEIWYTSSDSQVVNPHKTESLPTIVSNTYSDGKGIIKFNSNVTSIGDGAFSECSKLTSLTIPNSVTSIGSTAFFDCTGLTSIIIPEGVTSIGEDAFFNCNGLTSLTIPVSVTSIGIDAFQGCTDLASIIVESGNTNYDSRDNCNAIIETSSNKLITGCKNSTIPDSVTSIEDMAFYNCADLTSVTIPESVTNIGNQAFGHCTGLTSVIIPDSVTNIEEMAFAFSGLTSVTIGNGVTSIGTYAFGNYNVPSITATFESTTPPTIGSTIFGATGTGSGAGSGSGKEVIIYVPSSAVSTYKTASEDWEYYADCIQGTE